VFTTRRHESAVEIGEARCYNERVNPLTPSGLISDHPGRRSDSDSTQLN
jgi:hypothetical protein